MAFADNKNAEYTQPMSEKDMTLGNPKSSVVIFSY